MKRFARAPSHYAWPTTRLYDMSFIFFSNGRKPHVLPVFLLKNVPDQIVLMQALHNDDDAPGLLVIQSAVQSVIEPLVD